MPQVLDSSCMTYYVPCKIKHMPWAWYHGNASESMMDGQYKKYLAT